MRRIGNADRGTNLLDRQIGCPKEQIGVFDFLLIEKIDHGRAGVVFEQSSRIIGIIGELFDDICDRR